MIKKLLFLSISFLTLSTYSQEQYYNDVDLTLTGTDLKEALATKITNTHTNLLTYTPGVWEASKVTDANSDDTSEVVLIYGWEDGSDTDETNDRSRDNSLQDSGNGATFVWNREHVFSKSLADPSLVTTSPGAGTDAHNLRPADKTRNSERNNYKFASGSGNSARSSVTYSGPDGTDTRGWYPGDEWKGDVARIIMYMYLRYGDQCIPTAVGVGDTEFTPDDMIDLFLTWNVEDPVSDFEKTRNEFHENTTDNTYAQGNRNPFIDNPYLATRIWGGDSAEDIWGIYTSSDTEAPTVPTDLAVSNITLNSIDLSWTASTDNVAVTGYNVYVDGVLTEQVSTTSVTINELSSNTSYSFTVIAKDIINNLSDETTAVTGSTLEDTESPSVPTNLVSSNETDSSVYVSWDSSTDNTEMIEYEVYLDDVLVETTTDVSYTFSGLSISTSYDVYIIAKDASDNKSEISSTLIIETTSGSTGAASELFFSEYVEPDGGNNKALEIVNLTGSTISLVGYTIKKQSNGAGDWIDEYDIASGDVTSIIPNDVFVIINGGADDATLVAEADLIRESNEDTSYASPINFNGNDPIGLFKNGVLIDIIGTLDAGSSSFAQDITLRRNDDVSGPNTTFDEEGEWTSYAANTFDNIGQFNSTLSSNDTEFSSEFKIYPNPVTGSTLSISTTEDVKVSIYTVLGKEVINQNISSLNNTIDIDKLNAGMYIISINSGSKSTSKKLIKL